MLKILLLCPLFGALLLAFLPVRKANLLRHAALWVSASTLALSCLVLLQTVGSAGLQGSWPMAALTGLDAWVERIALANSLALGVDGFSLPLVVLTCLLSFVALLAAGEISHAQHDVKLFFVLMLCLQSAVLGVFTARDWLLFYVCWELTLIPGFFLLDRMGGAHRQRAALNFVLYTMGGSVFMLVALLLLYDASPGHSFAMADLSAGGARLPLSGQILVFTGLLIGFGVKMPIFPLHAWVPLADVEAPTPVTILFAGVLLKMGAYGLLRAAETLPAAVLAMQDVLALLAVLTLIYGAALAWRQSDLKKMFAYASISHMGLVLLGIASLNAMGLRGAMLQMLAHGLVAAMLFLLVGALEVRAHTRDISACARLAAGVPGFALSLIFACLAMIGVPGSAGFVAELHVLIGGFTRWGAALLVLSLALLIGAAYALRVVRQAWSGYSAAQNAPSLRALSLGERWALCLLAAPLLWIGLFPAPVLALIDPAVLQLARQWGH
ncbi:MAG: NADH-quinone oxidoreductase subunit M [Pseudomonadota bacterium]